MCPQRCSTICRTKAAQQGVAPKLYQQLMQEVELTTRYRTVFIPTPRLQILAERDEAFEALRRFHRHLEPDGELLDHPNGALARFWSRAAVAPAPFWRTTF